jgi:hypothetical protein
LIEVCDIVEAYEGKGHSVTPASLRKLNRQTHWEGLTGRGRPFEPAATMPSVAALLASAGGRLFVAE